MPYQKRSDLNPALHGIKPPLTVAQANGIAAQADAIGQSDKVNGWAVAIASFKKSHIIKNGKWIKKVSEVTELDFSQMSMGQQQDYIRRACYDWLKDTYNVDYYWYIQDVYLQHPTLGNAIICSYQNSLYAIGYQLTDSGEITFDEKSLWTPVLMTYIPIDEPAEQPEIGEFAESSTGLVELAEATADDEEGPLKVKIKLLEPGAGNKRDRHYYPREVLERDIHVFQGAKMYTTDHNQAEKNARTEVGTILECPAGFTETGAPLAIAGVHDPIFAKSIRNRQKLGTLEKLPVSILGSGTATPGKIDGQDYKIVQSLTEGRDVDFVTRAGAGGQAIALAESEAGIMAEVKEVEISEAGKGGMTCPHCGENITEGQMKKAGYVASPAGEQEAPKPKKKMESAEVQTILTKSGLSELAQGNLSKRAYEHEQELREVILDLKTLLAAEKGGPVVGLGESASPTVVPVLSLAERRKLQDEKIMGQPAGGAK